MIFDNLIIQRKDPPRLETKATEKSLNLKIKQNFFIFYFEGNSHPCHVVIL